MTSDVEKLTKLHLQAFGLTDYIIKELVKSLDVQCKNAGFNEYAAADIRASVEKRLRNPRILPASREALQRVLVWLEGESNVVPVDFLQGLSPEQRIEVLRTRTQALDAQEQLLSRETASVIAKANRMVAASR